MQSTVLAADHLDALIQSLKSSGFMVIGPVWEGGVVVYDEVTTAADLPRGWIDEQSPGHYRLIPAGDRRYFGYTVAANAWKKFLNPSKRLLWRANRQDGVLVFIPQSDLAPPLAFIGVRSCELHAIQIQDAVFVSDLHRDDFYQRRREKLFTVAVNCTRAASTCFCASMNTGPEVVLPADIVLTELVDNGEHCFVVEPGSERGLKIVSGLPCVTVQEDVQRRKQCAIDQARKQMETGPRYFDSSDIKDLLYRNMESATWDQVAERCLSCANCTLACPTCFCSAVEDTTDLTGEHAERWQRWDSCFNAEFTYIHGGSVRSSTRSRYRQWMTHKLASWIDQFGHSGCVGCGRCISWCPVGIDITEQLTLLREEESP